MHVFILRISLYLLFNVHFIKQHQSVQLNISENIASNDFSLNPVKILFFEIVT